MTTTLLTTLLGFGIVSLVVPLILAYWREHPDFQRPAELHHTRGHGKPRIGGLALAAAFITVEIVIGLVAPSERARTPDRDVIIFTSLAMFAVGFCDDLRPLGAKKKLLLQVIIAGMAVAFGPDIELFRMPFSGNIIQVGWWGSAVTLLWLVAMTNLVNLIDGLDGLAGFICLTLMLLIAFMGHGQGHFQLLAAGMGGALLAFLRYNFPPARIYLGDGGAYFLGFQIGLFALVNSQKGIVATALIAPMFVMALPILDTTLAILRRGLRGLPVFRPDQRHIHHRLLGSGFSRRRAVLILYAFTLVFLVMGILAYWSKGTLIPFLAGLAGIITLVLAGRFSFSREWFAVGRVVGNSLVMRQHVAYALSMMRILEMEGNQDRTVEDLWKGLRLMAEKLGFSNVKLTLQGESRSWEQEDAPHERSTIVYDIEGGRLGSLEVSATKCSLTEKTDEKARGVLGCNSCSCPCLWSPAVFDTISELLAEAWSKAARNWVAGSRMTLRFDSVAPHRKRRFVPVRMGEQRPQPVADPTKELSTNIPPLGRLVPSQAAQLKAQIDFLKAPTSTGD